jgi:xanthosine utilization system XapX-like protein
VSAWAIAAVVVAFALLLIALFTGAMNTRKQRSLYSVMYFVVFVSLLLPIVVSVMLLQSSYLVTIMEKAPIGLVRATSASSKTELQWFLNIGGVVTARDETSRSPRATPASTAASAVAPSASAPASQASSPRRGETRPASDRSDQGSVSSAVHGSPYIEGGLAVPFYVILLAMFGAGINLTRRVPEIQEEYSGTVPHAAPLSRSIFGWSENDRLPDAETQRQTFAFRRALIQNYMYVLSAPFLATAVYYLLQVVATEPARPILVLVSFATGLISDTLVNRIVRFAEETLKLSPADKAKAMHEAANARICSINAAMAHESAKAREAHHMARITLFQRRLEEALKGGASSLAAVEALEVPEFKKLDCVPCPDPDSSKPAAPADAPKAAPAGGAQAPAPPADGPKPAPPPGPPKPPPPPGPPG